MRPNNKTWWETAFPAVTWLRNYHRGWFRLDLLAGITLAAYLLPAALGDASLARLPPQAGLYACLFGGLVFWILCGSRQTSISVTSAISLVIGASLGEITGGNTTRFAGVARVAYRLHCLAGQGGSHGAFHLRECHDRLQIRRGTFSCQHTIAKALRFSRRAWKLLGKHGLFLEAPE